MAKAAAKKPAAKRGRPTSYRQEFVEQVAKLCALSATDAEIADFFGVTVTTLNRWKISHPDFCAAIKVAKEEADNRVERSLYNRAVGYSFDSEKIVTVSRGANMGSEIERVKIKEHVPPDVTAQIFWLKNRRKDDWRDRVQQEHSGPDGAPIEVASSNTEIAQRAAFLLAKAAKAKK